MRLNRIGTTDVKVTEISFGCASIGNLYRAATDQEAQDVLQCAWDAGIRYFDTAPRYGRGLAEQRLGRFLSRMPRDAFVVSTKVGRVLSPGAPMAEVDGFVDPLPNAVRHDYSGDGLEASLENSLDLLQTTYADIIFVHDIGTYTHGADNAAHMEAFLGSGFERLVRLKEQGRIRAFGLGVNENQICLDVMDHGPIDVILLAGRLTLLDRSAERELTARCRRQDTSLVLGGIFNSGILATGPVKGATYDYEPATPEVIAQVTHLQAKAEQLGVPLATAALHFARRHELTASVLLGTAKVSSLQCNLAALNTPVPEAFDRHFS
ncbi:aldo/keto reductase [Sedimentitalea todarodis]|uniref:Aldo/keto reductase n=1 Tax=Sedimentitalea todarodis TaxID=1631240 RepID=A0ABU3VHY1_9RHOB|nr:aldo/keto reductase [Sedimentitalea todarodis]MDU9005620.1 aldo/keto reductase [Sedimentitalea todarodis]